MGSHSSILQLSTPKILALIVAAALIMAALYFLLPHDEAFGKTLKKLHHVDLLWESLKTTVEIAVVLYGIMQWKVIRGAWRRLSRSLKGARFESTGEAFEVPHQQVQAVIIPVSRTEQPEWIIHHLKPEIVCLLYTERSKKDALAIMSRHKSRCAFMPSEDELRDDALMLSDPDAPELAKAITRRHIRTLLARGVARERIFVDTTGGKTAISIGAFQAAEEEGISSIYIVGTRDGLIKDPTEERDGRPIFMSDRRAAEGIS
ncbi:MAG: hypothetical protein GX423_13055 [Nitrospiraceae bacterium]|jgi:hypothetical protein|nr:hypothetical protein [Nitrospiraceae bacterium]